MILISFQAISQSIIIIGKVVDINNKHIPNAHIIDLNTKNPTYVILQVIFLWKLINQIRC